MTKYTPNHNWPIAEDTDVVKQYPTTVDEPFKMSIDALVPPGALMQYAGATAPAGWLLCQGQAVSRTTYAALFAVCGTTYGVGDGAATFNVPNLKGRIPAGLDTGQTEFNAMGKAGGAKTHTLTTAQMPSHSHSSPGSDKYAGGYNGSNQDIQINSPGFAGYLSMFTSTAATGGGGSHPIMQPYLTVNHIIKT